MVVTGLPPAGVAQLDDVLEGVLACGGGRENLFPLHLAAWGPMSVPISKRLRSTVTYAAHTECQYALRLFSRSFR